MLGRRLPSLKKLAKKVKAKSGGTDCSGEKSHYECLLPDCSDQEDQSPSTTTPTGFFAVYVGEERLRFVVPTSYLSHPLFRMLLDKSYQEFGYDQKDGLVVPCSVSAFQEVLNAVECSIRKFQFGELVEEFI